MQRRSLWEQTGWPELRVDLGALSEHLTQAAYSQGEVAGALRSVSSADCRSLERGALVATVIASSAIAHEPVPLEQAEAALARLLNDEHGPAHRDAANIDPRADGVASMVVDSRRGARSLLTKTRLVRWQREILATPATATVAPSGPWRVDEMADGVPVVRIEDEIRALLIELTGSARSPGLVRAALAYLRFVSIRPFAAGNGRIGRALADVVIAREAAAVAPFTSLARAMHDGRSGYEAALESAQRGGLDVTPWAAWFVDCYAQATAHALDAIDERLRVGKFWRDTAGVELNSRQRRVLERYLSSDRLEKISSRTYSAIAQTSTDSAQRDLADLAKKRIIVPNDGKARKTSYRLRDDFFVEPSAPAPTSRGAVSAGGE